MSDLEAVLTIDDTPPVLSSTTSETGPARRVPGERVTVALLLVGTLVLYTWRLSRNGWANDFYTAAVQAGSKSWKAFFFGSSDAGNTITVDKPPMSLWPQALAVRVFGLNAWSVLVPEALMGVAAVGVLYATIRRWFGRAAATIAGIVLALTPAAALMFRFNNPDALLALLLLIAAYAALRAIEGDQLRWYLLCGVAVGFGFLTKQLQAMLVVPGFTVAMLIAGQGGLWRRLRGLLIAGLAVLVSAGWWVAVVELWPKSSRPYIGGSTNNSFLQLTFGYNGLGRLTGNESGGLGGLGRAPGGSGGRGFGGLTSIFGGDTGISRMFAGVLGGQASWLIPAALASLVFGLVMVGRAKRTDLRRASLIVWGLWLLATGLTFSFMSGVFHEYYTIALAPAIGALVGIGLTMLWHRRSHWAASLVTALMIAGTTVWARVLLGRAPTWNTWLQDVVIAVGLAATVALLVASILRLTHRQVPRAVFGASAAFGFAALMLGPTAWSIQTVSTPHTGSIVTAGPAVSGGNGFGGGGFPGGGAALEELRRLLPEGSGSLPTGGLPTSGGGFGPGSGQGAGGGPVGGFGSSKPSRKVLSTLTSGSKKYRWIAAAEGATAAAPYQLATGQAVMPIGGFSGSDPAPTLAAFKRDVSQGLIHWFIGGGFGGNVRPGTGGSGQAGSPLSGGAAGGPPGQGLDLPAGIELPKGFTPPAGGNFPGFGETGSAPVGAGGFAEGFPGGGSSQSVSTWVSSHFTSRTVDGVTLYDLTKPKVSTGSQ